MYFQELKKAASALDSGFLYSVVSRLARLEQQSPNAVMAYQAEFANVLKDKSIEYLATVEPRLGTKGSMDELHDDIKYLLHGKHFDQFMRECQYYSSMPKPNIKADNKAFREWLRINQRNLAV
ncbi:hypothetical protein EM59_020760 [Vibrio parahaemolyticus]|uniref:hypothetical protein n=1 Tax=Vibrio parahaemolyticus TaxID=670 RepID=UPI0004D4EFE3|nr:hypothetical protein [Vibrio parahaemolyticus]EGQ9979821.1 hypothetical protein [Vibrio parahaemolyticus]ELB2745720.1 hypothetical protein [Vibrio parahaemolyticus]MEA5263091.1 hypothetical protein [Vibrio parahaemolyticus]OQU33560.1 hypothetical protein EM59_020760 [Vibrio parahaemolyticus]TPA11696.1 hypothetical protein DXE03_00225 [Vibrio parahaemolyticus]